MRTAAGCGGRSVSSTQLSSVLCSCSLLSLLSLPLCSFSILRPPSHSPSSIPCLLPVLTTCEHHIDEAITSLPPLQRRLLLKLFLFGRNVFAVHTFRSPP